ncbi:hypothetical protein HU200_053823 [Digitaria exilis]|uniref:UDP-glycosyltransferases domain-containing protein n=1 Tax=Digitaria exilis TaxID=1010633 RepID=A0A835AIR6_9POAL|nr:hypothetical protein HU200_053823 [Digitaria exilis]
MASCSDPVEYCRRLEAVGSETLARVIETEARAGRTPAVMVYDPHMSWARRVASAAGVPTAAFMSQPCVVDIIYGEVWARRVPVPMVDGSTLRRREVISVDLGVEDLPPFVVAPEKYPQYLKVSIMQFEGIEDADDVFVNSFHHLEPLKLSEDLRGKCKEKGLIVSWCPQLEALAHNATGCFLTHCGWNSTTEAIVTGVPMVAMPRLADQPTTAKYVESAWGIGRRMQLDEKGFIRSEEVEKCIREVMGGERRGEYRENAAKWMEKAKEAMQKGGSSDKNIAEFARKYLSV